VSRVLGRTAIQAIERQAASTARRMRKEGPTAHREIVLQYAEFWKDLIIALGGEPYTGYAVAADWCRGLLR
jgi:hypothetical protein